MLDFRRRQTVSGPLASRDQRRLLGLVALSVLVLILVSKARDGNNWRWLVPPPPAPQAEVPQAQVVLAQREPEAQPEGPATEKPPAEKPAAEPPTATPEQEVSETPPPAAARGTLPGVRDDYLSQVRDDTVFQPAESDAWFHLLDLLAKCQPAELSQASLGPVTHLQLDAQPKQYRGRVVTLSGTIRAAKLVAAQKNAFGIGQYYQLWLQTDLKSPSLVVIYSLELPEDFPLGESLNAPVEVTGIFYKRWAYRAQSGILTAPLVVAKNLTWTLAPVEVAPPAAPVAEQLLFALAAALLLALGAIGYLWLRQRDRRKVPPESQQVRASLAELARDESLEPAPVASSETPKPAGPS